MKHYGLLSVAALSVALAFSSPALASGTENGAPARAERVPGKYLQKVDKDGDGAISKEEFLAHGEERFNKMDADKDGKVTREEMKAHHETMMEERRANRDSRKGQERLGRPDAPPMEGDGPAMGLE